MLSKYYVYDEDDLALRWFYTKAEALYFIGTNRWTIKLHKPPKIDLLKELGEALI
jgi:hypothetical protein